MARTSGILKDNPVFALGIGLPFVIAPSVSLKNGVAISILFLAATLPCVVIAAFVGKKPPVLARMPLYALISIVFVTLAAVPLGRWPSIRADLGIYIPLTAVNTLMLEMAARHPAKSPLSALRASLVNWAGFAVVACSVSAVRELLGNRTLWEAPAALLPIRFTGVSLPFFGFILLGFFAALFRNIDRAFKGSLIREREMKIEEERGA